VTNDISPPVFSFLPCLAEGHGQFLGFQNSSFFWRSARLALIHVIGEHFSLRRSKYDPHPSLPRWQIPPSIFLLLFPFPVFKRPTLDYAQFALALSSVFLVFFPCCCNTCCDVPRWSFLLRNVNGTALEENWLCLDYLNI